MLYAAFSHSYHTAACKPVQLIKKQTSCGEIIEVDFDYERPTGVQDGGFWSRRGLLNDWSRDQPWISNDDAGNEFLGALRGFTEWARRVQLYGPEQVSQDDRLRALGAGLSTQRCASCCGGSTRWTRCLPVSRYCENPLRAYRLACRIRAAARACSAVYRGRRRESTFQVAGGAVRRQQFERSFAAAQGLRRLIGQLGELEPGLPGQLGICIDR